MRDRRSRPARCKTGRVCCGHESGKSAAVWCTPDVTPTEARRQPLTLSGHREDGTIFSRRSWMTSALPSPNVRCDKETRKRGRDCSRPQYFQQFSAGWLASLASRCPARAARAWALPVIWRLRQGNVLGRMQTRPRHGSRRCRLGRCRWRCSRERHFPRCREHPSPCCRSCLLWTAVQCHCCHGSARRPGSCAGRPQPSASPRLIRRPGPRLEAVRRPQRQAGPRPTEQRNSDCCRDCTTLRLSRPRPSRP